MSDLADIHNILRQQAETLGGIKSTVDAVKDNQDKDQTKADGLERRLRKVESRQHWVSGAWAAVSALVTLWFSHKT